MIRRFSWLILSCLVAVCGPLGAQETAPAEQVPPGAQQPVAEAPQVAVLCYSAFAATEGASGLSAAAFRSQMTYLREQGITPLSLQQFLDWHQGRLALSGPAVLITLDEADAAAYAVAFPVLREFGFPYVVFADGRSFQDSAVALNQDKLREMQQGGAAIGSRSMTRPLSYDWQHAGLSGPDAALKMAERELGLSAQLVTSAFGSCVAFAYPRGYACANMVENLPVYGYKLAFGLQAGKVDRQTPAYMINRYAVQDMPSFARAVNFGAASDDEKILQRVHAEAAKHLPVSQPTEVAAVDAVPYPSYMESRVDVALPQTPLPPVVDPLTGQPGEETTDGQGPIPAPVVEDIPIETLTAAAFAPRPFSTKPAAGELIRRTPDADWVTQEFPQPVVPREQTRVAVLGYHNFSNTKTVSDMLMRTSEFCQQMQYIRDAGLTVITMQDFLDWLLGERCLPERCVLITIDDGWRSVYTDAYPVLKAYGYPFTLFLYTTYLSGKGQSMNPDMVREMMANGATIGSHSTTHLYPSQWKRYAEDSPEYAAQLQQELPDSVESIKQMFGNCSTYCYPGGYHTPPMLESLRACGIQVAFTVLEKKVTTLEDPLQVHRYMVFGTDPRIFRRAVNFDDVPGIKPTAQGITEARERARAFFPAAFEDTLPPVQPAQETLPAPGPIPAPVELPAPKAELEAIPAPIYSTPAV